MADFVTVKTPSDSEIRSAIARGGELQIIQSMRVATDRAAKHGLRQIRQGLSSRRAARLGNAISSNSDLNPGRRAVSAGYHVSSDGTISVSGRIFVRGRGERTLGAIRSYVEQSTTRITPRNRSGLLWIPTDEIQRRVGLPNAGAKNRRSNFRLEPRFWNAAGLDKKIGPLVRIKSINGLPLLIVKNASVSALGSPFKAKSLRKNGLPRKGQRAKAFIVAFIGIPHTERTAKVNLKAILDELPSIALDEFQREYRRLTAGGR